jgi:hypothetical protein
MIKVRLRYTLTLTLTHNPATMNKVSERKLFPNVTISLTVQLLLVRPLAIRRDVTIPCVQGVHHVTTSHYLSERSLVVLHNTMLVRE